MKFGALECWTYTDIYLDQVHRAVFGCLLAVAVLAADLPRYPVKPAAQYSSAQSRHGLIVAAVAVDSGKDQRTYFGAELRSRGYRPVLVVIENQGSDSCILDRGKLTFSSAAVTQATLQSPATEPRAESAVRIASMVPTIPTLMGGVVAAKLTKIRHVLLATELQSATISPGSAVHGFVFVPVRKVGGSPQPTRIQIPVTSVPRGDAMTFEFDIQDGQ